MEYLKKYWYLIPLALLVAYIAYVVLSAKTKVAVDMQKVRDAKAEKAMLNSLIVEGGEN